jgi:hypothetical protein
MATKLLGLGFVGCDFVHAIRDQKASRDKGQVLGQTYPIDPLQSHFHPPPNLGREQPDILESRNRIIFVRSCFTPIKILIGAGLFSTFPSALSRTQR